MQIKYDDIVDMIRDRLGQTGERTPEQIKREIEGLENDRQNKQDRINIIGREKADI